MKKRFVVEMRVIAVVPIRGSVGVVLHGQRETPAAQGQIAVVKAPADQIVIPVEINQRGHCAVVPFDKIAAHPGVEHVPLVVVIHCADRMSPGHADHWIEKHSGESCLTPERVEKQAEIAAPAETPEVNIFEWVLAARPAAVIEIRTREIETGLGLFLVSHARCGDTFENRFH